MLLHHATWAIKELVADPLNKELLGAIRAPTPPLRRIVDQLEAIRTYEATGEDEPGPENAPKDYHPPLRERLANLGFAQIPDVERARTSAAEFLLSAAASDKLLREFNEKWRRDADAVVGLH